MKHKGTEQRQRRRSRLASASLTYNQVRDIREDTEILSTSELLCRRSMALFCVLIILGVGIAARFLIILDDPFAPKNGTTISPEN